MAFGAVLALTGCAHSPAAQPSSAPALASGGCTRTVALDQALTTRTVTDAGRLDRSSSGVVTRTAISGPAPIVPSVHVQRGTDSPRAILRAIAVDEDGVATSPGPARATASAFPAEGLDPGHYVTFTGADELTADFTIRCGQHGRVLDTGTVRTWANRTIGILQCSTLPPSTSTAALAVRWCPGAKRER